ncbi:MAG TPA: hypothetical protein VMX38_00750 [Verrucomicrobiae bacterium]|jgi:hypothetical protein|nr:hypothetical protein [Verrucomicrobiae bacterium]
MNESWKRLLLWAPRLLSIAYILFISLFALDVFQEEHGFWKISAALLVHLIPSAVLIVALVLAWRWEWVGAAVYGLAAVMYVAMVLRLRIAAGMKLTWILGIALPAFCVAALFLVDWIKRGELHATKSAA